MKAQNFFHLLLGKFKLLGFVILMLVVGCAGVCLFGTAQNSSAADY